MDMLMDKHFVVGVTHSTIIVVINKHTYTQSIHMLPTHHTHTHTHVQVVLVPRLDSMAFLLITTPFDGHQLRLISMNVRHEFGPFVRCCNMSVHYSCR